MAYRAPNGLSTPYLLFITHATEMIVLTNYRNQIKSQFLTWPKWQVSITKSTEAKSVCLLRHEGSTQIDTQGIKP